MYRLFFFTLFQFLSQYNSWIQEMIFLSYLRRERNRLGSYHTDVTRRSKLHNIFDQSDSFAKWYLVVSRKHMIFSNKIRSSYQLRIWKWVFWGWHPIETLRETDHPSVWNLRHFEILYLVALWVKKRVKA